MTRFLSAVRFRRRSHRDQGTRRGFCQAFILPAAYIAVISVGIVSGGDEQMSPVAASSVVEASPEAAVPRNGSERFVPVDQLDAVLQRIPNGVVLPVDQFQDLWTRAREARRTRQRNVPADMVVRAANYRLEQDGDHAVAELSLDIEQFVDEWCELSLPLGNLLPESATVDDQPAAVGIDPRTQSSLKFFQKSAGRRTLKLRMSTPLGSIAGDRVAAIPVLPNVPGDITIVCPPERVVDVNGLRINRPGKADESAQIVVPLGSLADVRVRWTNRQQQTDSQTLIFVHTDIISRLSADDLRWVSDSRVSVFGSSINQLVIRVPASLEITGVESAGLESWQLQDDPDQRGAVRVVLNYRQPFTADRTIQIHGVSARRPADGGTSNVNAATENTAAKNTAAKNTAANDLIPTLEFLNVMSHSGRVYVSHEDQLRLVSAAGRGIRHLGTGTAPGNGGVAELFDFWQQTYELHVAVQSRDRELFEERHVLLDITDTTLTCEVKAAIESLNAPLFELPLRLPAGWQLQSVTDEAGTVLKWRSTEDPLLIVVEPPETIPADGLWSLVVRLNHTIADPQTPQSTDLPVVSADGTLLVGGSYRITSATDLLVVPQEIRGLVPVGTDDGVLQFSSQGTQYSGRLLISRRPARISSRSVLTSWLDARQITTDLQVTVDVVNGTVRDLSLTLPEELGADLRFSVQSIEQVPGISSPHTPSTLVIAEQSADDPADGTRRFLLTFDRRFDGAVTLHAVVRRPRSEAAVLSAPFVRVAAAVRQHGLVVFEALPDQQLGAAPDADLSGLTPADPGLVESLDAERRVALVYRFVQPNYTLQIEETRFATVAVPTAVCERLQNISVVADDGTIQRSSVAHLQCSGVQTMRFELPRDGNNHLWSAILNGEPVEVRRDGESFLVALPAESGRTEYTMELLYESTSASETGNLVRQQSPRLFIEAESGAPSPVSALEQTWEVRLPSDRLLVDYDGGFQSTDRHGIDQPGYLKSLLLQLKAPTIKRVIADGTPLAVLLLVMGVVTALICRRRWKTLAAVCAGMLVLPVFLS
ncbi:MAG: hypothetical protein KDA89_07755, partial [Planctomycetaceae bacterium]|nr:hypothetical protein [Planctomycetaceae bacterium]